MNPVAYRVRPITPLKIRMCDLGITTKALAAEVLVNPRYLSALVSGAKTPSRRLRRAIATALKVPEDELWEQSEHHRTVQPPIDVGLALGDELTQRQAGWYWSQSFTTRIVNALLNAGVSSASEAANLTDDFIARQITLGMKSLDALYECLVGLGFEPRWTVYEVARTINRRVREEGGRYGRDRTTPLRALERLGR